MVLYPDLVKVQLSMRDGAVVGLEAMSKRNLVFQIIFIALLALIVVFMFFPETYDKFINMV